MGKIKLGVVFGGMSTEHEVSCKSGVAIIKNLNKEKYEICPIYIDKNGEWFEIINVENNEKKSVNNVMGFLKNFDVIFPVLHGLYGEDGTIQGLFELLKVPYVGCKVLASSVGMDKLYSKIIFEKAGLNQAKYVYIKKFKENYIYVDESFNERILSIKEISKLVIDKLSFPIFVKPSNSGSSVGINKANNKQELEAAIEEAAKFDKKILIEQGIIGREVECAVIGNENVISSCIGEVKSAEEFYSYEAKYNNQASRTVIPAEISEDISNEVRKLAIKAFKAIDGEGISRVDFFVENDTNKIFINEINTLPGFTNVSMYPKLFECSGIVYADLLDKLIEIAM